MKTQKRIGGWQCWVDIYEDYVIKTPKTKKEISETIKRYLDHIGKPEDLQMLTERAIRDIKDSISIIKKSNIPPRLLAYPEFMKKGKIKQKKAVKIDDYVNRLIEEGKKKEAKKIVDMCIDFIFELWKYGIHEKTFKFYSNFGILDNEIVLIDFLELTDNKEKVEKQIEKKKEKGWESLERIARHFPKESMHYFIKQAKKKITLKNLNKYWDNHSD